MNKYEQVIYLFKRINPLKKFSLFNYTKLNWDEVQIGYCNKDEILNIDDKFYIYSGEIKNHWNGQRPSVIRFKERNKIINEINV